MSFDALDRLIERHVPAWLHQADWTSWLWHTVIVLVLGKALSWATGFPVVWCWRLCVAVYAWREIRNVRDRRRLGHPLKPLDHVMDVATPWAVVELLGRWLA